MGGEKINFFVSQFFLDTFLQLTFVYEIPEATYHLYSPNILRVCVEIKCNFDFNIFRANLEGKEMG